MRSGPITAALTVLLVACSGSLAPVPDAGVTPDGGAFIQDGGNCVGDLATVGQGCASMFDGTAANLPACRFDPGNTRGRQQVWLCQDLIALLESDGFVGGICYYDATSHALVGASQGSDIGTFCGQTSLTIEAGRTNVMCLENAPTTDRLCNAPDGGG